MDLDKVDVIIENLKDMLKSRGDNIDEFEEHEVEVEREDFFNDNRPIDFHTNNTSIIFALTKNLRSIIIDNLKRNKINIDGFVKEFNGKYNIIGDFDFIIKSSLLYNFSCINSPLAFYRIHENNESILRLDNNIAELSDWISENENIELIRNSKRYKFFYTDFLFLKNIETFKNKSKKNVLKNISLMRWSLKKLFCIFLLFMPYRFLNLILRFKFR
jgi:hypothetical protein